MKKHWYFIYEEWCPVCNGTRVTRERRYGPRPKRWRSRHEETERYDGCEL